MNMWLPLRAAASLIYFSLFLSLQHNSTPILSWHKFLVPAPECHKLAVKHICGYSGAMLGQCLVKGRKVGKLA